MSNLKANHATVRRSLLTGKNVAAGLSTITAVCAAGAQSQEVQKSPVALQALGVLQQATTTAHGTLAKKQALVSALLTVIAALKLDFKAVKGALGTYELAVADLAKGDASVINNAGLLSRDEKALPAPLGKVTGAKSKPGKHQKEAIVDWPAGSGATGYALEVNYTPQNAGGTWIALPSGTRRRRVIEGPAPAAQFLVRIASLAGDGTQSEWSDPVLAVAR